MSPSKAKKTKNEMPWKLVGLALLPAVTFIITFFAFPTYQTYGEVAGLTATAKQAYADAINLASTEGNADVAIARLDLELQNMGSAWDANDRYTKAKLTIYKADIMLTYGLQFKNGFNLLGDIYDDAFYTQEERAEALTVAMAHALQGLDENLLTIDELRGFVLLNGRFKDAVGFTSEKSAALVTPQDAYPYLANGFSTAISMSPSIQVYALARSYSQRLLASSIPPPPEGGYYNTMVGSLQNTEAGIDGIVFDFQTKQIPYQEFIATSYYNVARAYEALPAGSEDVVADMMRMHDKLKAYVDMFPNTSYGTGAYLVGLSTRLVCKAIDLADYNSANVDKEALKPYLDELYTSVGWVVPCQEAFDVVAKDIDPRFAKYF
jgi:hypothetical protein